MTAQITHHCFKNEKKKSSKHVYAGDLAFFSHFLEVTRFPRIISPPAGAAYCSSVPGMQLAAVHATADHTLFELDVILSPAQYPPVEALVPNQPPFGIAQIKLPAGIPPVVFLDLTTGESIVMCEACM